MLTLLFDSGFWYDLIFIVLIGFIIFLCFKYPNSRVYVFSFLGIIFVGITAYCGIQLNYYYTAEGGVWGYITGLIENNTVTTVTTTDTAQFSLENIVLTQNPDGTYSATIYSNDLTRLEQGKVYGAFVNDEPCSQVDSSSNYVRAEYHYAFLDNNLDVLCEDTLQFNFAFYGNSSEFTLTTHGGQEAVNYWNTYFSRNNLVVEVKPIGYEKDDELSINGQIDDYVTLSYYVDDEVRYSYIYVKGATITSFPSVEDEGKIFECWIDEEGNEISSFEIDSNTNLYAKFFDSAEDIISSLDYNLLYTVDNTWDEPTIHINRKYRESDELVSAVESFENHKNDMKALLQIADGRFYLCSISVGENTIDQYHGWNNTSDGAVDITVNNYTINIGEDFTVLFRYAQNIDYTYLHLSDEDGGTSSTTDMVYFNYYLTERATNSTLNYSPTYVYFIY